MITCPVRKAIIPAAGFGTRLFPATKVVKKELFPIIDQDGRAKPMIIAIVEEAIKAGIEEVGIIIQSSDRQIFEDLFKSLQNLNYLRNYLPKISNIVRISQLRQKVNFITQEQQEGYGHAVFSAKEWVNNEPFVLFLGDHLYHSHQEKSCTQQLLEVYQKFNQSVIGLTIMPAEIIHKAGCVTGIWHEFNAILSITKLSEKPNPEYARSHLHTSGMAENEFLAVFGIYILKPKIFDYLEQEINHNIRYKGEFQLTTCLDKSCQAESMIGYLVEGQYFDTGMPEFYRQTVIDFYKTAEQ